MKVRKPTGETKSRLLYSLAVLLTIVMGLGSRVFANELPPVVSSHAGDALWAAMIYFGIRVLSVRAGLLTSSIISLLVCFSVEFSQLYQADWIVGLRTTSLGALILGRGFLGIDLLRYASGIALACLTDRAIRKKCGISRN